MLMDHQGSPRGRRVWNRPPVNRPAEYPREAVLCSNMAHPARIPGSLPPPSNSVSRLPRRSGTMSNGSRAVPPANLYEPSPDRRTTPIIISVAGFPSAHIPSPHSFSNPPAFLINLFSSPDVRWSGFNFRSRAIASTSSPCLATSLERYPTSPSDKNLGAPRLLLSSEIFSSPRDANNQLGNCTKNFH